MGCDTRGAGKGTGAMFSPGGDISCEGGEHLLGEGLSSRWIPEGRFPRLYRPRSPLSLTRTCPASGWLLKAAPFPPSETVARDLSCGSCGFITLA